MCRNIQCDGFFAFTDLLVKRSKQGQTAYVQMHAPLKSSDSSNRSGGSVVFLKKRPPMRVLRSPGRERETALYECQCGSFQTVGRYFQEPGCDDSMNVRQAIIMIRLIRVGTSHITSDLTGNQKSMSAQSVPCYWTTEGTISNGRTCSYILITTYWRNYKAG